MKCSKKAVVKACLLLHLVLYAFAYKDGELSERMLAALVLYVAIITYLLNKIPDEKTAPSLFFVRDTDDDDEEEGIKTQVKSFQI